MTKCKRGQSCKKLSNKKAKRSVGHGKKICPDCSITANACSASCFNCGFDFKSYSLEINGAKEKVSIIKGHGYILNKASKVSQGKKRAIIGAGFENQIGRISEWAWAYNLGGDSNRFSFLDSRLYTEPITLKDLRKSVYYKSRTNAEKREMREHIDKMKNHLDTDVKIMIDNNIVLAIEVKAYCEIAMLRRVVDSFHRLKQDYPDVSRYLIQFENSLGGDFSILNKKRGGSAKIHRYFMDKNIFDYGEEDDFPLDSCNIISLLPGKRDSAKPICDPAFRKEFTEEIFDALVDLISENLKKYI